jgi:chromosome segregation ATPase
MSESNEAEIANLHSNMFSWEDLASDWIEHRRRIAELEAKLAARQSLDEGYQAVESALGPEGVRALVEAHNKAQGRIKELEAENVRMCGQVDDAVAQLGAETKRWLTAVDEGVRLKAQLASERDEMAEWIYRAEQAEACAQNFQVLKDEMNGRLGDLLEAYEEVVAGNQALSLGIEKAKAQAATLEKVNKKLHREIRDLVVSEGHLRDALEKADGGHKPDCARQAALAPKEGEGD